MEKRKFEKVYQSEEDILLVLESYDDIFSDFDARSYSQKSISNDFLLECKRASTDKKNIKLKLFVPKQKRNSFEETKIKKRLKEHFNHHFLKKKKEINKIKLDGFFWFIIGCFMMLLSAIFLSYKGPFWFNLLITLVHPAGWFFMWEGLGKIFITAKDKIPDYEFYKKMKNSTISFLNC